MFTFFVGLISWNAGDMFKSMAISAVSAIGTAGIGATIGSVGSGGITGEIVRAHAHGVFQIGLTAAFGGQPSISTYASAALSSGVGSATHNASSGVSFAATTGTGALTSELTGGDALRGAATAATIHLFNHGMHKLHEGFETRSILRDLRKNGLKIPLDLSDENSTYKNVMYGLKILRMNARGKLKGLWSGPMHTADVFDFKTMNSNSGWDIYEGGGVRYHIFDSHPGIRITLQNARERITDIMVKEQNRIMIIGSSGRHIGGIDYHETRHDFWLRAKTYLYNED